MSHTIEFDLDSFTFIRAEIYRVDDSFDYDGPDKARTQKVINWEVKGILVMKYFPERDRDIDVTGSLNESDLAYYKEKALERFKDKLAA